MEKRRPKREELALLESYGITAENPVVLQFETDEELFRQGEAIQWFMFILKGTADIQIHAPNGGKLSFGYSLNSGTLGEIELLSDASLSTTTVLAVTPLECLAIPYEQARRELGHNLAFCRRMGGTVARGFSDLQSLYMMNLLSSGEQRLAMYILRKQRSGVFRGTLSDTASVIGVSYRHIFRMMGKLCEDGILRKETDGYHLLEPEKLQSIANA